MTIELDLNEQQKKQLEKIQQQYGLDSIEATADMLFKKRMMYVEQELTNELGMPAWGAT